MKNKAITIISIVCATGLMIIGTNTNSVPWTLIGCTFLICESISDTDIAVHVHADNVVVNNKEADHE